VLYFIFTARQHSHANFLTTYSYCRHVYVM